MRHSITRSTVVTVGVICLQVKCHMYWPNSGAGQYDYLQVILIGTTPYPDYTLR